MHMDFKVCVVLPGAGCSVRIGLTTPKQFITVLNRPIISHTISAFERFSWIDRIIVVVSHAHLDHMRHIVSQFSHQRATVICGAEVRHRSIQLGIQEIGKGAGEMPEVVVVHDAVRPLITEDILTKVCIAAAQFGASGAVRPLVSTVVSMNGDGFMDTALDRSLYRASEMPQAFRYECIRDAYEQATDYDLDHGTECLHLCQKYCNVKVKLIEGPECLWKVTHRRDIHALEGMLRDQNQMAVISDEAPDKSNTRF